MFLSPDESKVSGLVNTLKEKKIGIVAHFYMDPEVQGILTAAKKQWPHIQISDSLIMADSAVKMAEAGCDYITVLGVDFMSENVRAVLDQAGFNKVFLISVSRSLIVMPFSLRAYCENKAKSRFVYALIPCYYISEIVK
jgi:quinolinate synthase